MDSNLHWRFSNNVKFEENDGNSYGYDSNHNSRKSTQRKDSNLIWIRFKSWFQKVNSDKRIRISLIQIWTLSEEVETKAKDSNPPKKDLIPYDEFSNRSERGGKWFKSPL